MAQVISHDVILFAPELEGPLDRGVLEADGRALLFRGKKRVPELHIDGVTRVWAEGITVHVDYGGGRSVGFADYSAGTLKAKQQMPALAAAIRRALDMAEQSEPSAQQRALDAAAAAAPKGRAKIQTAKTWIVIGAVFMAGGLIWALAAEEVSGYAIGAVIVGTLRLLAGLAELHDGRKMEAGKWVPRKLRLAAEREGAAAATPPAPLAPVQPQPLESVPAALVVPDLGAESRVETRAALAEEPPQPAMMAVTPPPVHEPEAPPPATEEASHRAVESVRNVWSDPRRRAALIGGAVVLLAVAAFALGRGTAGDGTPSAAPSPPSGAATSGVVPEQVTPEPAVDVIPEDTVDTFYEAAVAGDLAEARSTFASGFTLQPGVLEGWGPVSWEITWVTAGTQEGELKIEVREQGEGFPDTDVVTYTLREESGSWKISGWFVGEYTAEPGFGEGAVVNPQVTRSEQAAVETLSAFLTHRMMGAVGDMESIATARMRNAQPDVFVMQFGDFTEWVINTARTEGDRFVVTATETWGDRDEVHEYVLVYTDGEMLVDERR